MCIHIRNRYYGHGGFHGGCHFVLWPSCPRFHRVHGGGFSMHKKNKNPSQTFIIVLFLGFLQDRDFITMR